MNISFENMVNVLEDARKSDRLLENYEMSKYDNILKGVAKKYGKTFCCDKDEIYSELCLKILKLGRANGWENLNSNLVAKIAYNRAVDIYRKNRREWDKNHTVSSIDEVDPNSINSSLYSKLGNTSEADISVLCSQILERYPRGSREEMYLIIKLVDNGVLPESVAVSRGIQLPEKVTNESIARLMGFKSKAPASFCGMIHNLRNELYEMIYKEI